MTTARRVREMGVRIALGATRRRLVGSLLLEHGSWAGTGFVVGGIMSMWTHQFLRASLYKSTDYAAHAFAVAAVVILVTAGLGTLIPALKASRTSPLLILKAE